MTINECFYQAEQALNYFLKNNENLEQLFLWFDSKNFSYDDEFMIKSILYFAASFFAAKRANLN